MLPQPRRWSFRLKHLPCYARSCSSCVVEQEHEAKIHVQLLMAMEQRQSRMIGNEIKFDFLKAADHDHILNDAGCRLAAHAHKLETVAVEMQRMGVVAGIGGFKAVAATFVHSVHRC